MTAASTGDAARIEPLDRFGILDTPPKSDFDLISKLACDVCEAPMALISLVDGKHQRFRSTIGLNAAEAPGNAGFCAHAIAEDGLFIVPDATTDERFRTHPHVLGHSNIRTCMGAPLVTKEGSRVGTLFVFYPEVTTIPAIWKERITSLATIMTGQLELHVELAKAERDADRSRDIVDTAGEWVWETDENHRYLYHSDNGSRRIFSSSQLIGRTRWELPGVDIDLAQFDGLKKALDDRQPFRNFEYYFTDQQGKLQHRSVSGNPVFSKDGRFKGYRGTSADITPRIETFESLKEATLAAEYANSTKSAFLANMSHELRTPLNAIIGFSDLMLSGPPDAFLKPEYFDYTSDIKRSGEDLLKIINDILDLEKIESGHAELNVGQVDVSALIQICAQRISFQAEIANLMITTLSTDDMPPLLADEHKLEQILINLLSNAVKFTPSHGAISVSADFSPERGHFIKVSDTGIGIAPDDFDKVLVPFQQADAVISRQFEGTGLGLPLSASYAEMHGGTLKIISEVGVGTTVEIRFPAERAILNSKQDPDDLLNLDDALEMISADERARSCLITDPRLPDNPIVYATPEFEKQTGYPASEVIGRNCRFLQGPMTDPDTVAMIRKAIEDVVPVSVDIINYRKDGSPFRNHLSIRPTFDAGSQVVSFVAVQSITDIEDGDL